MTSTSAPPPTASTMRSPWATPLCWLTAALEGFDLIMLGAVIPVLIDTGHVGITAAGATVISTLSLVGVAIGAAAVGPAADRLGRRIVLMASVFIFSFFTLLVPLMPGVASFSAMRLLAGIGMGACLPIALTLMAEHMPLKRRSSSSTLTMTGYHTGAVAASLLALAVVPHWQILFIGAGALGLVLVPVMWFKLPESAAFLHAQAREHRVKVSMFRRELLRPNIGIWAASFMGLLLVYGLNTWLPELMRGAGYDVSSSITMLFVLNIGAVTGLLLAGRVADKHGVKKMVLVWFTLSAILLALLAIPMKQAWVLNLVIFVTGMFVFSAQVLIYAYIAHAYPPEIRSTALGSAASIGRLGAILGPFMTGTLLATGYAHPWGFFFFAFVAVIGLIVFSTIPHENAVAREQKEIIDA